jgi:hypothetical protein
MGAEPQDAYESQHPETLPEQTMTKLAIHLLCTFAVLVTAGCSSEPTSESFRDFAAKFCEETPDDTFEGGGLGPEPAYMITKRDFRLNTYNLERTSSLTTPFIGTFTMKATVEHTAKPGQKLPDFLHEGKPKEVVLNEEYKFGWTDGKWERMVN